MTNKVIIFNYTNEEISKINKNNYNTENLVDRKIMGYRLLSSFELFNFVRDYHTIQKNSANLLYQCGNSLLNVKCFIDDILILLNIIKDRILKDWTFDFIKKNIYNLPDELKNIQNIKNENLLANVLIGNIGIIKDCIYFKIGTKKYYIEKEKLKIIEK